MGNEPDIIKINFLANRFNDKECIQVCSYNKSPSQIGEEIAQRNPSLIIINAEGKFPDGANSQEFKGIELLTWLRVKQWKDDSGTLAFLKCPIILYGFLSAQQILAKDPKNIIIHAPGNTYLQLPFSLTNETVEKIKEKNPLKKIKDNYEEKYRQWYKPYLKPTFNVDEVRHKEANWWGLKQLCDIHFARNKNLNFDTKNDFPENYLKHYPEIINAGILILNQPIAEFIYGYNQNSVLKSFVSNKIDSLQKELIELQESIVEKKLKKEIETATIGQKIWHWKQIVLTNSEYQSELNAELQNKKIVEGKISQIQLQLNSLNIDSEVSLLVKQVNLPKIPKETRILFVDDMADSGWAQIFSNMVFNKNSYPNFKVSECLQETDQESMLKKIVGEIKHQKTDILLLDLRLKDEIGIIPIHELGGYKILKELKNMFPGLNVIITSATNDAQTVKSLMNIGADFVWTKPGIDERLSIDDLVRRYIELLEQLRYLVYKFDNVTINNQTKAKEKLVWTKFRVDLHDNDFTSLDLRAISRFTDILVDTNFLLHDYKINLIDSVSNLYKLAYLKGRKHCNYTAEEKGKTELLDIVETTVPYLIIMNQIIDEILKISKSANSFISLRAQFAYQIIMDMYAKRIAHTEINGIFFNEIEKRWETKRALFNPKENVYADGFVLDEVGSYLVTKQKKFYDKYFLHLDSKALLLITDDQDLIDKALAMCPALTIWDIDFFNKKMNDIKI